jgi:hypothetical protein
VICRVGAPPATVTLRLAVAVCAGVLESVTFTLKENDPVAVGVPLIWPELLNVKPAGNAPDATVQVYGVFPPEAEMDTE